jgi:hypothetical protein
MKFGWHRLLAGPLIGLVLFNPEDGGDIFLENICWLSTDYTTLYNQNTEFFITTGTKALNPKHKILVGTLARWPLRLLADVSGSICSLLCLVNHSPHLQDISTWDFSVSIYILTCIKKTFSATLAEHCLLPYNWKFILQAASAMWFYILVQVDCKGFWRWCITLVIPGILDFVHRPYSKKVQKAQRFKNWISFSPQVRGGARHLLC